MHRATIHHHLTKPSCCFCCRQIIFKILKLHLESFLHFYFLTQNAGAWVLGVRFSFKRWFTSEGFISSYLKFRWSFKSFSDDLTCAHLYVCEARGAAWYQSNLEELEAFSYIWAFSSCCFALFLCCWTAERSKHHRKENHLMEERKKKKQEEKKDISQKKVSCSCTF